LRSQFTQEKLGGRCGRMHKYLPIEPDAKTPVMLIEYEPAPIGGSRFSKFNVRFHAAEATGRAGKRPNAT
jgi:hypothetical protein